MTPTGTYSRLWLTPAGLQLHRVAAPHVNTCRTSTHILWSCVASLYAMPCPNKLFFFNRREEFYFNAPQKGEDATSCTLGLEWASGFLLDLSRAWHVR